MSEALKIDMFVPGGVRPDDHVHHITNDNTCSRCRWKVPDDEVPLLVWIGEKGEDLLIYCETCLAIEPKEVGHA